MTDNATRPTRLLTRIALVGFLLLVPTGCGGEDNELRLTESSGFRFLNVDTPRKQSQARSELLRYPVENTTLEYGSTAGNRQQDTLVFVENPTDLWNQAEPHEKVDPTPPGAGVSWSGCNENSCDSKRDVSVTLSCYDFYGADACQDGGQNIKTAAVYSYDRGACSKRVDTAEVLQELVNEATKKMHDQVADGDPGLASTESTQYAQAQAALWEEEGNRARGGFQLNLQLDVSTTGVTWEGPCPFCVPVYIDYDASASVTGRYQWIINQGVLKVNRVGGRILRNDDDGDAFVLFGFSRPLGEDLDLALSNEIPPAIAARARDMQVQEIPDAAGNGVECSTAADCVDPEIGATGTLIAGLVFSGLPKSVREPIQEVVKHEDEWICDGTCKMLIRARHVNVYPDAVELVFREGGGYPAVRESAIEILLNTAGRRTEMCDPSSHGEAFSRPFSRVSKERTYD